jgi:hypothetical protein
MTNDALTPNTVKTMMLMPSAIFNVRNTFTVPPLLLFRVNHTAISAQA